MKVKELIEILNKIEDKELGVSITQGCGCCDADQEVTNVTMQETEIRDYIEDKEFGGIGIYVKREGYVVHIS